MVMHTRSSLHLISQQDLKTIVIPLSNNPFASLCRLILGFWLQTLTINENPSVFILNTNRSHYSLLVLAKFDEQGSRVDRLRSTRTQRAHAIEPSPPSSAVIEGLRSRFSCSMVTSLNTVNDDGRNVTSNCLSHAMLILPIDATANWEKNTSFALVQT